MLRPQICVSRPSLDVLSLFGSKLQGGVKQPGLPPEKRKVLQQFFGKSFYCKSSQAVRHGARASLDKDRNRGHLYVQQVRSSCALPMEDVSMDFKLDSKGLQHNFNTNSSDARLFHEIIRKNSLTAIFRFLSHSLGLKEKILLWLCILDDIYVDFHPSIV